MKNELFLEIAGIKIKVRSQEQPVVEDEKTSRRYKSFLKKKTTAVDIELEVDSVKELPGFKDKKVLFEVVRDDIRPALKKNLPPPIKKEKKTAFDWRISENKQGHILESRQGEVYASIFNQDFTRGKIYLQEKENSPGWKISNLVYGPLQILLMHYLAKHKSGILIHSVGVNHNGEGFLFVGKTRAGKSTSGRLWHKRSDTVILNDDRIIVRKIGGKLIMFGTPWHGDFSDYIDTIASSAPLKRLFFIYHHPENLLLPIKAREAFNRFFPNTFPVFWDKEIMSFTVDFLHDILQKIPAFSLGFVNDDRVVDCVRNHK